jgi:hypothetical protein
MVGRSGQWHADEFHQRHIFFSSHPVTIADTNRDLSNDAPLFLWLLREKEVVSLQMNVYTARYCGNEPTDYPEVRETVARARELFPEANVLDIEAVMRGSQ